MRVNPNIPKPLRFVFALFLSSWAILIIWITVEGMGLWVDHARLLQFGEATQGVVVDTRILRHRYVSCFVEYEFSPQFSGELLKREVKVSEAIFEDTTIGNSVSVRYLPTKPEVSNLEDNNPLDITDLRMEMVLSPVILITVLLIGGVWLARKREWL